MDPAVPGVRFRSPPRASPRPWPGARGSDGTELVELVASGGGVRPTDSQRIRAWGGRASGGSELLGLELDPEMLQKPVLDLGVELFVGENADPLEEA